MVSRSVLCGIGLLALTVFAGWPLAFRTWGAIAANWGEYHLWASLFDPVQLLLWSFVAGLFVVFSFVFVILCTPAHPIKTSVILGTLGGASMFLLGKNYIVTPSVAIYIWTWGVYLMAPMGALAGASLAPLLRRTFRKS